MGALPVILVDTMIIIECHLHGCWTALANAHHLETVEKCVEETQTGKLVRSPQHTPNERQLRSTLKNVHTVSEAELAIVLLNNGDAIHAGEQQLWAHALTRTDDWRLCGPDRGSYRFGYDMGLKSKLISLQELFTLRNMPYPATLDQHYGSSWHGKQITDLTFGIL